MTPAPPARGPVLPFPPSAPLHALPIPAGKGSVFQLHHVQARVVRLDELTRGLRKEIVAIAAGEDPLLYLERKAYMTALRGAVEGLDQARVVLAGAAMRLEGRPD